MNSEQSSSRMRDLAYGGHLWMALFSAVAKALENLCRGKLSSTLSVLLSAFGAASGTARARAVGVRRLFYLPLSLGFSVLGLVTMGMLMVMGNPAQLSADQLDILAAAFVRARMYADVLACVQEARKRTGSRPNTRALLDLREIEAVFGIMKQDYSRGDKIGTMAKEGTIALSFALLVGKLEDLDPENRSRVYRSKAQFHAYICEKDVAVAARSRAIELAADWPGELAKAKAIRFDWE